MPDIDFHQTYTNLIDDNKGYKTSVVILCVSDAHLNRYIVDQVMKEDAIWPDSNYEQVRKHDSISGEIYYQDSGVPS